MSEPDTDGPRKDPVAITAIVVAGAIILACIIAASVVSVAFFLNAPW